MLDWMMRVLALPEVGLSTVFFIALVASTLVPLGSEPAVFGLVKLNPDMFWPAILAATAGATIGGAITWWMGYGAERAYEKVTHKHPDARALKWLQRFGPKACLLSWLPVVGDPLCAVAGWLKLPFWPCVALHDHRQVRPLPGLHRDAGRRLPRPVLPLGGRSLSALVAMTTAAYDELARHWSRLHRFGHVYSIASWDRAAMMPAKGNEARAAALAEMDALLHGLRTEPRLAELIARAEQEPLDDVERANLREIRRSWTRVERAAGAAGRGAVARRPRAASTPGATQRPAGDWAGFLVNLREVVRLAREEAKHLADATGLAPYDALMDQYEPGMTSAEVAAPLRRPAVLAAGAGARRPRAAGGRGGDRAARPVPEGGAAGAEPRGDGAARLRLRGRAARRERASVQRRRARGHAPHHALPRRRLHAEPDGHDPRDRPRALRAEPAARLARPAGGARALDGDPREPEPVLRDAARPQRRRSSACSRRCSRKHFGAAAGVRGGQPAAPADPRRARPDPRRCRRAQLSGARDPALRHRAAR